MYNEHLLDFFDKYGIHDVITEVRKKAQLPVHYNGGYNGISADDFAYIKTLEVDIANLKLPADSLTKIAEIVTEWDQLYKNPESAKLLHEARFINRLYNGL